MGRGIYIVLILVLSTVPSWSKNLFNIPDPVDVDCRDIVNKLVQNSFVSWRFEDLRGVMLRQTDEPQEIRAADNVVMSIGAWHRKADNQKMYDGRNTIPPKKNGIKTEEQFAWCMEDKPWLEREARCVTRDAGMRNNFMHDRRPKARAEPSQFLVRGLLSSIRVVGAHYRISA
jgi:hypothetical protein